jgi:hypothetical protein
MNKQSVTDLIHEYAKEGDVINLDPVKPDLIIAIGAWGIRTAQRELFGEMSNWKDDHSMIYFRNRTILNAIGKNEKVKKILGTNRPPFREVFSVEPPKATFISHDAYAGDNISVYRYTIRPLTAKDIRIMLHAALPILLTKYDYGQLLNIAVNQMLGYPFERKTSLFDFSRRRMVCSVGVAAVYQKWRKILEATGEKVPPRLFSRLNPAKWSKEFRRKFEQNGSRWHVENTYPAHFANTDFFNNEFRLVLRIERGVPVFKEH